ncbi:unnamed protein product [Tilletia laevis]|uniref:Uncharacterized protein n=2 Tax=Tilletia TaxID=13289 RepID=A0A177U4F5_9BASI|nr:hypothetical protein CF336_g6541 [Tilletia laevis]KAE8250454.1 hypothetical protein A4X03_0g6434 [Tilletia caries]KAE8191284.1 hypothetical protein CF335_g6128 [Tilletia laevis]CAD6890047.1 unnamed protein product [Tilletia caries]CAD6915165.1 unnamed protein product [Tilletia caries]
MPPKSKASTSKASKGKGAITGKASIRSTAKTIIKRKLPGSLDTAASEAAKTEPLAKDKTARTEAMNKINIKEDNDKDDDDDDDDGDDDEKQQRSVKADENDKQVDADEVREELSNPFGGSVTVTVLIPGTKGVFANETKLDGETLYARLLHDLEAATLANNRASAKLRLYESSSASKLKVENANAVGTAASSKPVFAQEEELLASEPELIPIDRNIRATGMWTSRLQAQEFIDLLLHD